MIYYGKVRKSMQLYIRLTSQFIHVLLAVKCHFILSDVVFHFPSMGLEKTHCVTTEVYMGELFHCLRMNLKPEYRWRLYLRGKNVFQEVIDDFTYIRYCV